MSDDLVPERPPPPLTWRDVLDRVVPPERAAVIRAVAVVVAIVAVAGIVWWAVRPPSPPATELSLPFAPGAVPAGDAAASTTTTAAPAADIVVHAAGAVVAPGVHRLPAGSRVADLLAAAGGATADADLDRVNLAAPLTDGQRVWFPRIGEAAPPDVGGGVDVGVGDGAAVPAATAPIDLNTATAAQLEELPGVGPSIAAAIIEHREREGPFRSVDELLDVPGIGPARLEQLRDLVTV